MIPRGPHEVNLTQQIGNAPGQERFIALDLAVKLAVASDHFDTDSVVGCAEKFHAFLAADGGETAQEGSK